MNDPTKVPVIERWVLGTLAIGLACGISAACLWPFHAPKNDVSWLADYRGLQFGHFGTVMSSGPFEWPEPGDAWSLELSLEASKLTARKHFLTFYSPRSTDSLSLRQDKDAVVLSTQDKREESAPTDESIYVDEVFRSSTPVFLSVTAGEHGTAVFVDGTLRGSSDRLRLPRQAVSGQLILGDAPLGTDSWSGRVQGLAIYGSELSPAEVSRHFERWSREQSPALNPEEHPAALYFFNEGAGSTIHNRIHAGVDLTIPERYTVAGKLFLEGPLHEYNPIWSYSKSIVLNVLGFVPFGYAWYGYLSLSTRWRKSTTAVATVFLGGALSFTMEVLQAFLPTRSSGIADIITNTAGTALGVAAYRFSEGMVQSLLARVQTAMARAR